MSRKPPDKPSGQRQRKATRDLFDWLKQVKADAELLSIDFTVAFEIGNHFNHKRGGVAWPSTKTIAANISVGKATVIRAVSRLSERGYLIVEPGRAEGHPGRGHSNRYRMSTPDIKGSSVDPLEPRKGPPVTRKGSTRGPEPPKEPPTVRDAKASPHEGERGGSLALASPPGARSPYGIAHLDEVKGQEVIAPGDRFPELASIWSRPWIDNDEAAARRAFAEACRQAEPEEIIGAAQAWVAAVEPRYLPPLTKWLSGRGWAKQPPSRRQQRNRGKVSLVEIALRRGGHS